MSLHVAAGWPNACNMLRPTMFRSVAFKCYDRLVGACKCLANSVTICCFEMLLSFGRDSTGFLFESPHTSELPKTRTFFNFPERFELSGVDCRSVGKGPCSFSRRDFLKSDCTVSQAYKNCSI